MPRPVLMQQHAGQRPARTLAPMRTAAPGLLQKPLRLQEGLGPSIAPVETMILHQVLVKMLRREAGVARAVKRFHLVRTVNRNPPAGSLAQPPVQQSGLAILFVALTPAPERPFTDTQKLRRLTCPSKGHENYRTDRVLHKPDISCATDTPLHPG